MNNDERLGRLIRLVVKKLPIGWDEPLNLLVEKLTSDAGWWWRRKLDEFLKQEPSSSSETLTVAKKSTKIPAEMFSLHESLGIFTVPEGYVHRGAITALRWKYNNNKAYSFAPAVNDAALSNTTTQLVSGQEIEVIAFQPVPFEENIEKSVEFLKERVSLLIGAYGLALALEEIGVQGPAPLLEEKGKKLQRNACYLSFDEDRAGNFRLSALRITPEGGIIFDSKPLPGPKILLSFSEHKEKEAL